MGGVLRTSLKGLGWALSLFISMAREDTFDKKTLMTDPDATNNRSRIFWWMAWWLTCRRRVSPVGAAVVAEEGADAEILGVGIAMGWWWEAASEVTMHLETDSVEQMICPRFLQAQDFGPVYWVVETHVEIDFWSGKQGLMWSIFRMVIG